MLAANVPPEMTPLPRFNEPIIAPVFPSRIATPKPLTGAVAERLTRERVAPQRWLGRDLRVVQELAYMIVRTMESYVYTDLITGEDPNPEKGVMVLRVLLRP